MPHQDYRLNSLSSSIVTRRLSAGEPKRSFIGTADGRTGVLPASESGCGAVGGPRARNVYRGRGDVHRPLGLPGRLPTSTFEFQLDHAPANLLWEGCGQCVL